MALTLGAKNKLTTIHL